MEVGLLWSGPGNIHGFALDGKLRQHGNELHGTALPTRMGYCSNTKYSPLLPAVQSRYYPAPLGKTYHK